MKPITQDSLRLAAFWVTLLTTAGGAFAENEPAPGGESFVSCTADGAWCWFADPRAVYVEGKRETTFAGWVTSQGDVELGAIDHTSGEVRLATIHQTLQVDDHCSPGILVLPDRRLMVFYSQHSGRNSSMFYRIATNPESINTFGPERNVPTNVGGAKGFCYANPYMLRDENDRIYLFWRGGNFKPVYATTGDGIEWTDAQTLIDGAGDRPYVKYVSDNRSSIHFAFTDGHPRNEPLNSIYYAVYRKGAFFRADGAHIGSTDDLPITPEDADRVYAAQKAGRAWIWDIALNDSVDPVLVYSAMPEETLHTYRYARWDGIRWRDYPICDAGRWFPQTKADKREREPHYSGGIVLDHANPSTVYLSRQINGEFEIEMRTTDDGGATWSAVPITRGSHHRNVRPFHPRGYRGGASALLWMHGDYEHYTRYRTGIKMNRRVASPVGQ